MPGRRTAAPPIESRGTSGKGQNLLSMGNLHLLQTLNNRPSDVKYSTAPVCRQFR
jgi:hypothetical protein